MKMTFSNVVDDLITLEEELLRCKDNTRRVTLERMISEMEGSLCGESQDEELQF